MDGWRTRKTEEFNVREGDMEETPKPWTSSFGISSRARNLRGSPHSSQTTRFHRCIKALTLRTSAMYWYEEVGTSSFQG